MATGPPDAAIRSLRTQRERLEDRCETALARGTEEEANNLATRLGQLDRRIGRAQDTLMGALPPAERDRIRLFGDLDRGIPSMAERIETAEGDAVAALEAEQASLQAKFAEGGEWFNLPEPAERPKRFIAYHDTDTSMSGRSFDSAREAKIAVEDMLRRRQHQVTWEEYAARAEGRAAPPVVATYENLSGVRPIPPPDITPEAAAANRAAAAAVSAHPGPMPPRGFNPPEMAPTPQGEILGALEPPAGPRNVYPQGTKAWEKAFADWREMLRRVNDPELTERQRAEAARQARSMGAAFRERGGKYYSEVGSRRTMIEDIAWQTERDTNPEVVKARRAYDLAVAQADSQAEAMVYVKHHNPITGEDEYTRIPGGSTRGFGEPDVERVPVQIEPPTKGEVPTGQRIMEGERPWEPHYQRGEQRADRAVIDYPGIEDMMLPENRREFVNLREQGQEIQDRLNTSAANEQRLAQMDEAAKRAYTEEVQAADEAVKEAKRAEAKAEFDFKENETPASGQLEQTWRAAQRNTQEVVAQQTQVRQAWMEADRAWKAAVADRDMYVKALDDVAAGERRLMTEMRGSGGEKFVEAARRGELPPMVASPKGGLEQPSQTIKTLSRQLREVYAKLDAMDDVGATFLTETQRRDLVGQLNSIDVSKRELINQAAGVGMVKQGREVLPMRNFELERQEGIVRPDTDVSRFNELPPQRVPPVVGSGDDLKARAFAESFNPTEPGERTITSLGPAGELQENVRISGTQPYQPITEREAIAELERMATDVDANFKTSGLGESLQQQLGNIERSIPAEQEAAAGRKAEIELLGRAEQNEKLAPLKDQVQTYVTVNKALDDKASLIPQRAEARAQRKVIVDAKVSRKADIVQVADDIEKVARQNPKMLDKDLTTTEALLHDVRQEAQRVTDNDLTAKQVQGLIDKVGDRRDNSLDIMLTTVGKNWRMLYETNGVKKPVLAKGDIIVQADLHKMFTNLYDNTKDRVLFGRTLNAFTNLFKTYATLSPGFHVRNALSAIFMNATDGVGLGTQLSAARIWREYMGVEDSEKWLAEVKSLHGFSGDQIRDAMAVVHGTGAGGRFTEAGFAEAMDEGGRIASAVGRLQRNKLTRFSQRVGERVEGSVRMAMALDSMRMGDDVESAIQRVNRIHFDYGEISKLDENMKRVIPFWTFMSRNMPMQVSQMWTHPRVYLGYQDFVRNFSAANEEYTPEYWTKAGVWNTGLKVPDVVPESFGGGLPISAAPDLGFTRLQSDVTDMEDFLSGKRMGGILSNVNPIISAPVEYATRQDIFTGQKFEKGETVPVGGPLGWPVRQFAKLLGQEEGGEVDAAFMNALRAVNPIMDRETRLLPQATGGDPEAVKRQLESWLRFGGVPTRTLTPKQQDNEFFRRYYEQLDAAKMAQKRAQRQAS